MSMLSLDTPSEKQRLIQALEDYVDAYFQASCKHPLSDLDRNIQAHVEKTVTLKAFELCQENRLQTSKLLGITRQTLKTRLKRHAPTSS